MSGAALVLVLAVAIVQGGGAAPLARIEISDSALRPAKASVDRGGRVAWKNRGRRTHVVRSSTGLWRPLVIAPGRTRTVRLKAGLRGCEHYLVDGRMRGVLLIGVSGCGGGGGGVTQKTYKYNVKVEGFLEAKRDTAAEPDPPLRGVRTATMSWTGTWKNLKVRVLETATIVNVAGDGRGAIRGEFAFSDTRSAHSCEGRQQIGFTNARAIVGGSRTAERSGVHLSFSSATPIESTICVNDNATPPNEEPHATVQGLDVSVSDLMQDVTLKRTTGRTAALIFPLNRLRSGASFTVSTGEQVLPPSDECGLSFCVKTVRFRARVTFTPTA